VAKIKKTEDSRGPNAVRSRNGAAVPAELRAAAARLFQQRGYAGVTIDDIVNEVGVTKGGFYHYFASKGEMLFELHDEYVSFSIERFRTVFDLHEGDPAKQLEAFVRESFNQIHEFQEYVGLLFDERRSLPPEKVDVVEGKKAELRAMLMDVINAGIASGEFRKIDARAATLAIFGMCTWGYLWYRADGDLTPEQLAREFSDIALAGLVSRT
jgi:AcrR family transcriptional regulator